MAGLDRSVVGVRNWKGSATHEVQVMGGYHSTSEFGPATRLPCYDYVFWGLYLLHNVFLLPRNILVKPTLDLDESCGTRWHKIDDDYAFCTRSTPLNGYLVLFQLGQVVIRTAEESAGPWFPMIRNSWPI